MNHLWQHIVTVLQAWSCVAWFLLGLWYWLFKVGSQIFTACVLLRWWWRAREA